MDEFCVFNLVLASSILFIGVPIRLVNGSSIDEGRVEVYQDNQWSTICGKSWSNSEAQVLCQSLGFGRYVVNQQ